MKNHLTSILLAGTMALTSYAGPKELHESLCGQTSTEGAKRMAYREFESPEGYKVKVTATSTLDKNQEHKTIIFEVSDTNHLIRLTDIGADGLGKNDNLELESRIAGDNFNFNFKYLEKEKFDITGYFTSIQDGKTMQYGNYKMDTSGKLLSFLDWISRGKIVKQKIQPMIDWSEGIYQGLTSSVENSEEFKLPYKEFIETIEKLDPMLPKIRTGKMKTKDAIMALNDDFLKIMKN